MHFRVTGWLPLANTFSGTTSENGLYIGLPLLVVLIAGAIALRHRLVMKVAALTTIAAFIVSLGSRLTVGRYVWTAGSPAAGSRPGAYPDPRRRDRRFFLGDTGRR